jgi:hypothetical protein
LLDPGPRILYLAHGGGDIGRPIADFDRVEGVLFRDGVPFRSESLGQDLGHACDTVQAIVEYSIMNVWEKCIDGELKRRN